MKTIRNSYDCVVLGGGPAGSTVAALVADQGFSTLLVEREAMPRFHVGESLMPETYWTFQRLGVLDKMRNSDFVKKYSAQFVAGSGKESQPFYFEQHDPRDCSQTWQVERAPFDHMLFENAAEKGADCHDQTRVRDVLFDGPSARGVDLQLADGTRQAVTARVVVDATGQQSLIANRLGLRDEIPELKKAAIWTYFRNAERDPGQHGGATIIMHTSSKQAWFWYIPLSNDITSIGVVSDHAYLLKGRGTPAETFAEERANCPALLGRLAQAERVDEYHIAKEFSYTTRQHAGDVWVLVGDAFGFIDPIYSSGVYFALKTGEMAADAIVEGFAKNDLTGAQLGGWTDDFKSGAQWIRKLVSAYYTQEFSFGRFMKDHPEHQGNLTDILIGRIFYDGAGRIFDDLDPAMSMQRDAPRLM
ncbi:MAG: tryptophan 7-halogenase [Planctomycetales bacterium]|nr:tryptophan 7-halogenase [Planctomycetales bacterium]